MGIQKDDIIVFYDGECGFCSAIVNFIMDRNSQQDIYFASLQSDLGQATLKGLGMPLDDFDTIVCKKGSNTYKKSGAFFMLSEKLDTPWNLFRFLRIIPSFISDFFYDIVAKLRFQIIGKTDRCRLPSPEDRFRFLDLGQPV